VTQDAGRAVEERVRPALSVHPLGRIGETLGTKQLARLFGIQALFTTFGFALGPIIAGRIFDLTHSYSGALVLFSAMALIASLAIRATLPLAEERARQVPAGEPATA
jgi:MFS family permease